MSPAGAGKPAGRRPRLRASYIWDETVQADVLTRGRRPVTIGPRTKTTFFTPEFAGRKGKKKRPQRFPILRPHRQGATLAVTPGMNGTATSRGGTVDIAEFLAEEPAPDEARDGPRHLEIRPGDWGVVHLDGRGDHVLFFHFTEDEPPLGPARLRDTELLWPALAFTALLFLLLIAATYLFREDTGERPEGRELIARYLVDRPDPEPIVAATAADDDADEDTDAADDDAAEAAAPEEAGSTADAREEAPEPPRQRTRGAAPDDADEIPEEIERGLLTQESRDAMTRAADTAAVDDRLGDALEDLDGLTDGGERAGGRDRGTRRDGDGPGGGGEAHTDATSAGELDTGGTREASGSAAGGGGDEEEVRVTVQTQSPSGSLGGLTAEEINRVVRSRQNAIQACYERELQRHPNLSGRVVVRWEIGRGGEVTRARVRSSSMNHGATEDCIQRQVRSMRFPSPGEDQLPVVNYPFVFDTR